MDGETIIHIFSLITRIAIFALVIWIIVKLVKFIRMIILKLLGDLHTMAEARKMEAEAKMKMAEKSNGESKQN